MQAANRQFAGQANQLAVEVRDRLGPPPELPEWPLVSIVVLNRDGADHLRRLLAGLSGSTDYPELEMIVVDNGSTDESLELLRSVQAPFPLSFVANAHNESFSDACNRGAEMASGELLLFLNNDAEPFEPGWLRELVGCLRHTGAGAVGATLLEPNTETGWAHGYAVHQRGLRLLDRGEFLAPAHRDRFADPLGDWLGRDAAPFAIVAACLLIERAAFERTGGFTSGYWYGPEDVDLCLKLRELGMGVVCSGRSILIHPPSSTLNQVGTSQRGAWVRGNRRLFMERWGPRVWRELELDRLAGDGVWAEPSTDPDRSASPGAGRAELEELSFCLLSAAPPSQDELCPFELLATELRDSGHRCLLFHGSDIDDLRGLTCDVAVYLGDAHRYAPAPGQLSVLWVLDGPEARGQAEDSRYDLVWRGRDDPAGLIAAVKSRAQAVGLQTRIGVRRRTAVPVR